jgi:signal transduction histidine kinase
MAWGTISGEKNGLFGSNLGTSLFTIVRVVVFISLAFLISKYINKFYEQRLENEKALKESEARYHDIKEVDRLKSQFIAVISHELRTPLTIIKGFSAYLDRGVAGGLNEKQKNFVGIISHNTERLGHMIGEMTTVWAWIKRI